MKLVRVAKIIDLDDIENQIVEEMQRIANICYTLSLESKNPVKSKEDINRFREKLMLLDQLAIDVQTIIDAKENEMNLEEE